MDQEAGSPAGFTSIPFTPAEIPWAKARFWSSVKAGSRWIPVRIGFDQNEKGVRGNLLIDGSAYLLPEGYTPPGINNYSAGLNLTVPFDLFTERWEIPLKTARLQFEQQTLDLKETVNSDSRQWEDMSLRFKKSIERISQAQSLEDHDKEKADKGEALLKGGRLSLFEALAFEGQYAGARLNRLAWILDRLSLLDQAELFQAKSTASP